MTNQSNSWIAVAMLANGRIQAAVSLYIYDTPDPNNVQGFVYHSTDYGKTWTKNTSLPKGYYTSVAMSGSGAVPNTGLVLASSDVGRRWVDSGLPNSARTSVYASQQSDDVRASNPSLAWAMAFAGAGGQGSSTNAGGTGSKVRLSGTPTPPPAMRW